MPDDAPASAEPSASPPAGAEVRVLPAGPCAALLEVVADPSPDLSRRIGAWRRRLWTSLAEGGPAHALRPYIYEVIPGYRSLMIEHAPRVHPLRVLRWAMDRFPEAGDPVAARQHVIPVAYGADADRDELEQRLGMTFEQIAEAHQQAEYTVAFLGFTAGFPYLLGLPQELVTGRRSRPRSAVPPGAVAMAGSQAGIYPSASPGGWWILGRTSVRLFDPEGDPPALLAPGDDVRFVAQADRAADARADATAAPRARAEATEARRDAMAVAGRADAKAMDARAGIDVIEAWPRSASLQGGPRRAVGHLGMAETGALDPKALEVANELVGNPRAAAALEAVANPVALVTRTRLRAAVTGGGLAARLDGVPLPRWTAFTWPAGAHLELVPARSATGHTAYLAIAGAFEADVYAGVASTDARAGVGGIGRFLEEGDRLFPAGPPGPPGLPHPGTPRYPERIVLRLHPGPQHDADAWRTLVGSTFRVAAMDRTGARLAGPTVRLPRHEVVSEGSPHGAVQVPPGGEPIVLLADRGRTGGYAKPAVVDPGDLWQLAQAPPGTEVWFADARRPEDNPYTEA